MIPEAGYLIVKTFNRLYYEFSSKTRERIYSVPCEGVGPDDYEKKYRGLDRDPLEPWYEFLQGITTPPSPEERQACEFMAELYDSNKIMGGFILSAQDALDVWSMLPSTPDREIIWAKQAESTAAPECDVRLLGYEPTWFIGDHFSAVCDSMCFPTWHGTDDSGTLFEDFFTLLNEHCLFNTPKDAERFLKYYTSIEWAESGDYVIAQVHLAECS